MRPRTVAVLFLVVAGLLAFIWFYERQLPGSDERVELARRVLRLEAEEVTAVTLAHGDSRVRLERQPSPAGTQEAPEKEDGEPAAPAIWRLREPLEAVADRQAVERLVEQLAGLEKERTLEGPDAAELGLEQPRGRVILESGGEPIELVVGSEVPASSTMIVAVAGREEAYVVGTGLWDEISKPGGDWRSRELGPDSREAIQRVALVAGDRRLILGRRGDAFWVESPFVDRADRDLVSTLLGELTGLRVERFVDTPPEPRPELGAGVVEVEIEGREEPLRIELAAAAGDDGELHLTRVGGQLFESRTDLAAALERPPGEWRARTWSGFEVFEIDRLAVREAGGETVFSRDAGDWLRDGEPVPYGAVSDLLYALTGVEAERLEETVAAGEPVLTLELAEADGERRETLTLHPAAAGGASAARVSGRQVTLLLGEGTVADLRLKLDEALSAEPPPADDDLLEAIAED